MPYSKSDKAFLRKLGFRIRKVRESKDWSQEQFAFECNLHRTYIGAVERGERNVSVLNLRKVARTLGVPIKDILPDD